MNEDFKHFLLDDLLADSWGGWKQLDRDFLERLCERVEEVAEKFIDQNTEFEDLKSVTKFCEAFSHEDCHGTEWKLREEIVQLVQTLEDLEEKEANAFNTRGLRVVRV